MRMTSLNAGDHFKYNGITYKKLQDREKGNKVENVQTGEICALPLMLTVDKISEVKPKKEKKAKEEKEEKVEIDKADVEVKAEETIIPPDGDNLKRTFPNIIVD